MQPIKKELVKVRRELRGALGSVHRIDWPNAPLGESEARLDLTEYLDEIEQLSGLLRIAIETGETPPLPPRV